MACLTYTDYDGPHRWAQAAALRAADPGLTGRDVYAAAAVADVGALRRQLAADPAAARREGGPFGWEPLLYLAYARVPPAPSEASVLEAARMLLAEGADPDAGYLWHDLPTPFTVLTGAFGEGELGPVRQPRHPHATALARLLLEAGADPNDSQALYNRMFSADDAHLRLLFAYGLGRGDGGPWRRRLGDAVDPPAQLLRGQLRWALTHGMAARVRLLVAHGVDAATPYADGATPAGVALTAGHGSLAGLLGVAAPELEPVDAFVAAALAGDAPAVRGAPPDVVAAARAARPGLVAWAATLGRPRAAAAVALLAEAGFDVSGRGRTDLPREEPWETALHHAAQADDADLARVLLAVGADPSVRDGRFHGTPLDWARHFGNDGVAAVLAPVTPPA
jgi:hypothetical protein